MKRQLQREARRPRLRAHLRPSLRLPSRYSGLRVHCRSATRDENPLPTAIRQNIANLGLFVLSHTIKLEARPEPSRLDVLININREVAAGLRASS